MGVYECCKALKDKSRQGHGQVAAPFVTHPVCPIFTCASRMLRPRPSTATSSYTQAQEHAARFHSKPKNDTCAPIRITCDTRRARHQMLGHHNTGPVKPQPRPMRKRKEERNKKIACENENRMVRSEIGGSWARRSESIMAGGKKLKSTTLCSPLHG